MSLTTNRITELLHLMRAPAAGFTESHQLAEVLHQAISDDCKLALLEFCKGLLLASRNVAQLQIDVAVAEAERNSGSLQ